MYVDSTTLSEPSLSMEGLVELKVSSSTSDPRFVTPRLDAFFDFFGLGTATPGVFSTFGMFRGSVEVVVSSLTSTLMTLSSCDIVEIVSFCGSFFVMYSFVRKFSVDPIVHY